jgi:hypothetical protein
MGLFAQQVSERQPPDHYPRRPRIHEDSHHGPARGAQEHAGTEGRSAGAEGLEGQSRGARPGSVTCGPSV